MLDTLSARELIEWQEWWRIEHWHAGRDEAVAWTVANVGARILNLFLSKPVSPAEILPPFGGKQKAPAEPRPMRDQQDHMIGLTLAAGGKVVLAPEARARMEREIQAESDRIDAWMAEQQQRWKREHGG